MPQQTRGQKVNRDVDINLDLSGDAGKRIDEFTKALEGNYQQLGKQENRLGSFVKSMGKAITKVGLFALSFVRLRTLFKGFGVSLRGMRAGTRAVQGFVQRMSTMPGVIGKAGQGLQSLGMTAVATASKFGLIGIAVAAAIAAIVVFIVWMKKSWDWVKRNQEAMSELNYALIANRNASMANSESLERFAEGLSRLYGYAKEDIVQLAAMAQALELTEQQTQKLMLAVLRLSEDSGQDLLTTYRDIEEALRGNNEALRKYGIDLREVVGEQDRLNAVFEVSEHRTDALEERSNSLAAAWEDFKLALVELGAEFVPILKLILGTILLVLRGLAAAIRMITDLIRKAKELELHYAIPVVGQGFRVYDLLKELGIIKEEEQKVTEAVEETTEAIIKSYASRLPPIEDFRDAIAGTSAFYLQHLHDIVAALDKATAGTGRYTEHLKAVLAALQRAKEEKTLQEAVEGFRGLSDVLQELSDKSMLEGIMEGVGEHGLEQLRKASEKIQDWFNQTKSTIQAQSKELQKWLKEGWTLEGAQQIADSPEASEEMKKKAREFIGMLNNFNQLLRTLGLYGRLLDSISGKFAEQKSIHDSIVDALEAEIEKRREILRFAGALSREEQLQLRWLQQMVEQGKLTAELWERLPEQMRRLALSAPDLADKMGPTLESWGKKRGFVDGAALKGKTLKVSFDPMTMKMEVSFDDVVVDETAKKIKEKVQSIADSIAKQVVDSLEENKAKGVRNFRFKIDEVSK